VHDLQQLVENESERQIEDGDDERRREALAVERLLCHQVRRRLRHVGGIDDLRAHVEISEERERRDRQIDRTADTREQSRMRRQAHAEPATCSSGRHMKRKAATSPTAMISVKTMSA